MSGIPGLPGGMPGMGGGIPGMGGGIPGMGDSTSATSGPASNSASVYVGGFNVPAYPMDANAFFRDTATVRQPVRAGFDIRSVLPYAAVGISLLTLALAMKRGR